MAASSAVTARTVPAPAPAIAGRAVSPVPKPPTMMLPDRPVHRVGHQLGEDATGRADQRPGDDQRRVAEDEAGHRDRGAGEGVEQRDDDRHVGAADRQHHGHPEGQRGQAEHDQRGDAARVAISQSPPPTAMAAASSTLSGARAGERDRAPRRSGPAASRRRCIEPEKVTAPISTSRIGEDRGRLGDAVPRRAGRSRRSPTRAAAPPPTALKRLTSCGMAVISTVRAAYRPAAPPSSAPAIITIQPVVVTRAARGRARQRWSTHGDDHAGGRTAGCRAGPWPASSSGAGRARSTTAAAR